MQDERLLTYAELAAELGVSVKAAKARARRAGWPKVVGNDARAPVQIRLPAEGLRVPATYPSTEHATDPATRTLSAAPDVPLVPPAVAPPAEHELGRLAELAEANAKLRVEIARLQEQLAAVEVLGEEKARAAQAVADEQVKAARAVAIADVATAQAEVEGRDALVAELRARVTDLQAELAQARRPWWRRLWPRREPTKAPAVE